MYTYMYTCIHAQSLWTSELPISRGGQLSCRELRNACVETSGSILIWLAHIYKGNHPLQQKMTLFMSIRDPSSYGQFHKLLLSWNLLKFLDRQWKVWNCTLLVIRKRVKSDKSWLPCYAIFALGKIRGPRTHLLHMARHLWEYLMDSRG